MAARVGKYLLFETLGEGAFGKVKLGVHEDTGEQVAVKIMDKGEVKASEMTLNVRREIAIMKALKHKNIVNMHQVLSSANKLYIVMDLVTGGELFTKILNEGALEENIARSYFQQLVEGVEYCHKRGVCHRDLKPENLLIDEATGELKITDFGLSAMRGTNTTEELLHTQCGSPNYCAPEIITCSESGYNGSKVDVWSCGIILFALLAGYLPFFDEDTKKLYKMIQKENVRFPKKFPQAARSLVNWLLTKEANERPSLTEIKRHPWFMINYKGQIDEKSVLPKSITDDASVLALSTISPVTNEASQPSRPSKHSSNDREQERSKSGKHLSHSLEDLDSAPVPPKTSRVEHGLDDHDEHDHDEQGQDQDDDRSSDSQSEEGAASMKKQASTRNKAKPCVFAFELEDAARGLVKMYEEIFDVHPSKGGLFQSGSFQARITVTDDSKLLSAATLELLNECKYASAIWYVVLKNGLSGDEDDRYKVTRDSIETYTLLMDFWIERAQTAKERNPGTAEWWNAPIAVSEDEITRLKRYLSDLSQTNEKRVAFLVQEVVTEIGTPSVVTTSDPDREHFLHEEESLSANMKNRSLKSPTGLGRGNSKQIQPKSYFSNPFALSNKESKEAGSKSTGAKEHTGNKVAAPTNKVGNLFKLFSKVDSIEMALESEKCIRHLGVICTEEGGTVLRKRGENKMKVEVPVVNSKEPMVVSILFTPEPGKTLIEFKRAKTDKSKTDNKHFENYVETILQRFRAVVNVK